MTYESYISMSREALLAKMETVIPEKRLRHCLGSVLMSKKQVWQDFYTIMPKRSRMRISYL